MTPRALRSAPLGEELDHLRLTLRGGPHQRGLPAEVFLGVDVGAGLEQPLGRFDVAARATAISAVSPSGFVVLGSAPALSNASMIGAEPTIAASVIAGPNWFLT